MTGSAPEFREQDAQQAWTQYFLQVDSLSSALTARQRRDIRLEITAHLLESYVLRSEESESERLRVAIERLGSPAEFVPGWVEDRLLHDAAPGSGVRSLLQLLKLNARRGATHLLASLALGFGYLLAFYFFFVAALKPVFPDNVGLISTGDGFTALGYIDTPEMVDLLGYWIMPLGFIISFSLIVFLDRMLQRFSRA